MPEFNFFGELGSVTKPDPNKDQLHITITTDGKEYVVVVGGAMAGHVIDIEEGALIGIVGDYYETDEGLVFEAKKIGTFSTTKKGDVS